MIIDTCLSNASCAISLSSDLGIWHSINPVSKKKKKKGKMQFQGCIQMPMKSNKLLFNPSTPRSD